MKHWRRLPISYFLTVLILVLAVPCAQSGDKKNAAQQTKSSDHAKAYVAPTDPRLYVGSDTCKTCHEDIYTNFESTAHFTTKGKLEAHKGVEWHGCEASMISPGYNSYGKARGVMIRPLLCFVNNLDAILREVGYGRPLC
jgi:hypothetical protein